MSWSISMILLYDVPVRLSMDGLDRFGARRFGDAKPHLLIEVDQAAQERTP